MEIELRGIKYYASMSEETSCFEATIYIDGQKACRVSNRGHGGADDFDNWEVAKRLDAYGATLPVRVSKYDDPHIPGKKFEMKQDAESLVSDLLMAHLTEQDKKKERAKFERDLKTKFLFTKPGQKGIFETKKQPATVMECVTTDPDKIRGWIKNADQILNLLPAAEAWALFDANIQRVTR